MLRNASKIGFGLFLLAILIVPRFVNQFEQGKDKVLEPHLFSPPLTHASFGMLGFHLYQSRDNHKSWEIQSDFAELHRKENLTVLKTVAALFHANRTGNEIRTQSDTGRSQLDSEQVYLEGNVVIRSKQGYQFEMKQLRYDGKIHEFFSNDWVEMKGPDLEVPQMYLEGQGLWAHIDSEHFKIKSKVSARKRLASKEWLKIRSESGDFFSNEQRAFFKGRVFSTMPKVQMESDTLEMLMGEDREALDAKGHVHLKQAGKTGWADRAFIETDSHKVILEGRASVESKGNKIQGTKIIIYTDEDRIEVEKASGRVRRES